jgi:hypothetical protein
VRKGAKRKKVKRGGEKERHFSTIENWERKRKRKKENTSRQRRKHEESKEYIKLNREG